jgi:hypothetical protein
MPTTTAFTYTELIAEIQDVAEDSSAEFVAEMPTIVANGESRLYADFNLELFDRVRTGALTASVFIQSIKPTATWQGTRSLFLRDSGATGLRRYLQRRTYEYCQDFSPDESVTAEPIYYSEYSDTEFFMVPAPDDTYAFELREISRDAALILGTGNENTWIGDHQGDVLLYSCMIFAETYLKSDQPDVDKWKTLYQETMTARRTILRRQLRGDYAPIRNAARSATPQP